MFRAAFPALALGNAPAFVAPAPARATTVVNAFENEIGAKPPLGFIGPLGMPDGADQGVFDRLRYAEVKHDRICMLGVAGWLTTSNGVRLPGDIDHSGTSFASIGTDWDAT